MNASLFKGMGVALVSPFRSDKSVDFSAIENLVNFQIENACNYIVALGTTSETATLSTNERSAIINFIVEINNRRVPIVVGVGGNNTNQVAEQLRITQNMPIDGILSVTPYYNKPNQKGLFEHFKAIANTSNLPIILYNVPGRTSVNILPQTTLQLAKNYKNIVAIKEASGNLMQAMQIIKEKPNNFALLSGDDALTLPLIAMGAEGVISVIGNAYPKQFSDMIKFALNNEFEKAKNIHYQLIEIMNAIFEEGNPTGIKALLAHLQLVENYLRLPLVEASEKLQNKIKKIANKIN